MSVVKDEYPDSHLRLNKAVLFKGELEDNLRAITGGVEKDVIIQFFPLIPYDIMNQFVGQSLYAYPHTFKLRVHLGAQSPKLEHIQLFFLCHLPYDQVKDFVETIAAV